MAGAKVEIIAVENIKFEKKYRTPGTKSEKFSCTKKQAEQLIGAGVACLPQTLEERNQPAGQKEADKLISDADAKAAEIVKAAEDKAVEIVKAAEDKAAEIASGAGNK